VKHVESFFAIIALTKQEDILIANKIVDEAFNFVKKCKQNDLLQVVLLEITDFWRFAIRG